MKGELWSREGGEQERKKGLMGVVSASGELSPHPVSSMLTFGLNLQGLRLSLKREVAMF